MIAAIGRPAFIRGEFIKPGATVIDVGVNQLSDAQIAALAPTPNVDAKPSKRGYALIGDVRLRQIAGRKTRYPAEWDCLLLPYW